MKCVLEFEIDFNDKHSCISCPLGETGECLLQPDVDYTISYVEQFIGCPFKTSNDIIWRGSK